LFFLSKQENNAIIGAYLRYGQTRRQRHLASLSAKFRKFELIAVQGHPRSSILVSMESPYDFLLVTNSNFGRICYRFRDIDAKS